MSDRIDDDDWLDALRGRPQPGIDASTAREAQDLRRALLDASTERGTDEAADQQELQRLLFRMRREGVLSSGASVTKRWRTPIAVAAAIAFGVALTTIMPTGWWVGEDDTVLRGGEVQVIEVGDVPSSVQQLERILRASGAAVVVTDIGDGAREVAATVPPERVEAVARELAPLGVKPPGRDGALRVDIRAKL